MRLSAILSVCALFLFVFGVADAREGAVADQYGGESDPLAEAEGRLADQNAELERRIDEVSAVGGDLADSQSLVDGANVRTVELREEAAELRRNLDQRRAANERAKENYEESVRQAYKNGGLEGVDLILESLLGSGGAVSDPAIAQILFGDRDALREYREAEQTLEDTMRQISEKNNAYDNAVEDEAARAEELRQREAALDAAVEELRAERDASAIQLREIQDAERARILETAPATGGAPGQKRYELRLARQSIVAEEVAPIPYRRYEELYRESARQYGFAPDWHILVAVGKVESDHGQNMGPSTAGAMGPMQFLPSTWETSGVDGNGDGVANIMDPEDAIPAAAKYLQTGGAPDDWYAALYSYNHADWYVRKVLAVAEGYRRLAGDETVGPYTVGG